jgi:hypothetical protein
MTHASNKNASANTRSTRQATTPLRHFFQSFETNTASSNMAALIAQFADVFMAAGPNGAQSVRSADFALALPKRLELFQSLGCQSTKLVSCHETQLDARFFMAETRWQMTFVREGQPPKEVMADSLYIVDMASREPKIVFYLAHQDLVATVRNQGIHPA